MGRRSGFNLFLIGYRCTGKSSVGQALATKLGWPFIDTDSLLVSESGLSIKEVVDTCGWQAFRRLEHTALQQVCAMDRQVVATGGGQDQDSVAFRPALTSKDRLTEIEETLAKREPLYQGAMDFAVDTDYHGVDEICDVIIGNLKAMD